MIPEAVDNAPTRAMLRDEVCELLKAVLWTDKNGKLLRSPEGLMAEIRCREDFRAIGRYVDEYDPVAFSEELSWRPYSVFNKFHNLLIFYSSYQRSWPVRFSRATRFDGN